MWSPPDANPSAHAGRDGSRAAVSSSGGSARSSRRTRADCTPTTSSALDHVTTAALTTQALTTAFERLLQRLVVLAALHGDGMPAQFLGALATAGEDSDVVDLAAAFLEHGTATMPEAASEIQQEIVHFSRIVDIGQLGLGDAHVEQALRRLRGSQRLPDSLKVLSELIVVVRSRLTQRGQTLPSPRLRPDPAEESDTGADVTTAAPPANPDYWVAVRCGRRRN